MRGITRNLGAVLAILAMGITASVGPADAVIIDGIAKGQGLAKVKLSPLFEGGDGPVTIVAQINGAGDTTSHPAVLFVISVKGKLLGQKLDETFHEEL